jgi:hypothetical protein
VSPPEQTTVSLASSVVKPHRILAHDLPAYRCSIAGIFGIAAIYNGLIPFGGSTVDPMSFTWSGIQAQSAFQNGSIPMSILVSLVIALRKRRGQGEE